MKSAVGIVVLALTAAIVALIVSGVVRYDDDALIVRVGQIEAGFVPVTLQNEVTALASAIVDQTVAANTTVLTAVSSNGTMLNSGTVRWYSNCQLGWRLSSPDSYAITNNAKSYDDLAGKPESNFSVWWYELSNGQAQTVIAVAPPVEPIAFTDEDNDGTPASCKVYAMASTPVWVEFLGSTEHTTFALTSTITSQNVMTLSPPCDGVVCDFLAFVNAIFYNTPGSPVPLQARLSMTVYSDTYEWRHNEATFVARNLTITDTLRFPIML
jgi:hypothetical protein